MTGIVVLGLLATEGTEKSEFFGRGTSDEWSFGLPTLEADSNEAVTPKPVHNQHYVGRDKSGKAGFKQS